MAWLGPSYKPARTQRQGVEQNETGEAKSCALLGRYEISISVQHGLGQINSYLCPAACLSIAISHLRTPERQHIRISALLFHGAFIFLSAANCMSINCTSTTADQ